MSPDTLKKFVVKIEYINQGSGVIFKPDKNSQYAYIFTAKHNFFNKKDEDEEYKKTKLPINPEKLKITRELAVEKNITVLNNTVYFLDFIKGKSVDFAFLIIDLRENDILYDVSYLELEDSWDGGYDISNQEFIIYGYPHASSGRTINTIHPYGVEYTQNTINKSYHYQEDFSAIKDARGDNTLEDDIKGLSGSGVFLLGKNSKKKLRAILVKVARHETFICIKLECLLKEINTYIATIAKKHNIVLSVAHQCGEEIIIENEALDFSDISNFNFFKKRIEKNMSFEAFCSDKKIDHIRNIEYEKNSIEKISQKIIKKVNSENKKIQKNIEGLSFVYAKLAILSHENKNKHATTRYFKQAIKLNETHKQALLLERESREKNKKNIIDSEIDTESVEEKIFKLRELFSKKEENDKKENRDILIKIISIFDFFLSKNERDYTDKKYYKENRNYINNEIEYYINDLVCFFENESSIRLHYRYEILAELFYNLTQLKKYAIYFFIIARDIVQHSPKTIENEKFTESINNRIETLNKYKNLHDKDKIKIAVENALSKKEEYFNIDTKEMISHIYDETAQLIKENEKSKLQHTKTNNKIQKIKENTEDFKEAILLTINNEIIHKIEGANDDIKNINKNIADI